MRRLIEALQGVGRTLPIFVSLAVVVHLLLIYLFWIFAFPRTAPLNGGGDHRVSIEVISAGSHEIPPSPGRALRRQSLVASVTGAEKGSGETEGLDRLLAQIRARIERSKHYPALARKFGLTGRSLVRFEIDGGGTARQVALKTSSGSNLLDDEALATIRRAAPFPRYPDPLEVWIRFDLR